MNLLSGALQDSMFDNTLLIPVLRKNLLLHLQGQCVLPLVVTWQRAHALASYDDR